MSIYQTNINTIIAALYHQGLQHVVICPGSRNAPLIMAFVRFGKIKCTSVADERSAAFIALGMAKQLQRPVAVICTSGSAVLNLYPAVAEAFYMQVPLMIITADRPAEMIDRWDGQTIHQFGVFRPHILDSYTTPEQLGTNLISEITGTTCAFYQRCNGLMKGPVHLNVPLAEPLYAAATAEFVYPEILTDESVTEENKEWEFVMDEEQFIVNFQKVLVLHGAENPGKKDNPLLPKDGNGFAVVLSDCMSNRHSEGTIKNWEGILLNASVEQQRELVPDLLITTGKMVLNKSIKKLFRKYKPGAHWHIDETGYCANTFFTDPEVIPIRPEIFFSKISRFFPSGVSEYLKVWHTLSKKQSLYAETIIINQFNAFLAVRQVLQFLPENMVLHLANSMSVRYAAYLNSELKDSWQIYSNRGVSGIDGCTSTALGAAMVNEKQHVLITGDIAFFYDINALWQQQLPSNFKIVLLNDFGGGIFKNIDGPRQIPELNPYLGTPHQMDASLIAQHFRIDYQAAGNIEELMNALPNWLASSGPSILEIKTDSEINSLIFNNYKQQQI